MEEFAAVGDDATGQRATGTWDERYQPTTPYLRCSLFRLPASFSILLRDTS